MCVQAEFAAPKYALSEYEKLHPFAKLLDADAGTPAADAAESPATMQKNIQLEPCLPGQPRKGTLERIPMRPNNQDSPDCGRGGLAKFCSPARLPW